MGEDRYRVSRQAATGFSGSGTLKAEALKEADEHCKKAKKAMVVDRITEAKPPYILGVCAADNFWNVHTSDFLGGAIADLLSLAKVNET